MTNTTRRVWISTNANHTTISRIERELHEAGFVTVNTGRYGTVLVSETSGGQPCKTACDFREVEVHTVREGAPTADLWEIVDRYTPRTSRGGWTWADMATAGNMIAGRARIKTREGN